MFKDFDKFSSKFVSNVEVYELFKSAVSDYCETYDISDLRFSDSPSPCVCEKNGCSFSFSIEADTLKDILDFCDDFNYFLDNTPTYKDLVDLPFELRELVYRGFCVRSYYALFWYSDPFESETNAPDLEGGEG